MMNTRAIIRSVLQSNRTYALWCVTLVDVLSQHDLVLSLALHITTL